VNKDDVKDEELLFRCVFYGKNYYTIQDGKLRISSQAFADRNMQPSVDRAILCNNNPEHTQVNSEDGVVGLISQDIRMIDNIIQRDNKGNEQFKYKIDVIPRPIENNFAHAQVEPSPEYKNKSTFRKVQERLARLASEKGWAILPIDLR
jgi:hypothetical protein